MGRLPIEDLKLIAWHELICNTSITAYTYKNGAIAYYYPGGAKRAWARLGASMNEAAKAFEGFKAGAERVGKAASGLAHELDLKQRGGDGPW